MQLLKKPTIEFYETQDLSSPNGKPKLLFYDYSWHIFFLQPITEGNCELRPIEIEDFISDLRLAAVGILCMIRLNVVKSLISSFEIDLLKIVYDYLRKSVFVCT